MLKNKGFSTIERCYKMTLFFYHFFSKTLPIFTPLFSTKNNFLHSKTFQHFTSKEKIFGKFSRFKISHLTFFNPVEKPLINVGNYKIKFFLKKFSAFSTDLYHQKKFIFLFFFLINKIKKRAFRNLRFSVLLPNEKMVRLF